MGIGTALHHGTTSQDVNRFTGHLQQYPFDSHGSKLGATSKFETLPSCRLHDLTTSSGSNGEKNTPSAVVHSARKLPTPLLSPRSLSQRF